MHGRTLGSVLIGLGLAAAPAGQTFRSGVDLVTVGVTVTDRAGEIVRGLTRDDFLVLEDGRAQTLTQFTAGIDGAAAPDPVPTHLGLLFDTSGSMEADLALARSAAIKFLNTLPEAADITLVDFDTEVRVARYGQGEFPRIVERIRGRKAEGDTALYDALGVYLDGAAAQNGRKVLVLYTDGGDTRSALRYGDLMTLLKASDVTVHAVGFLDNQGSASNENQIRLRQIVEQTGGRPSSPASCRISTTPMRRWLPEFAVSTTSATPRPMPPRTARGAGSR